MSSIIVEVRRQTQKQTELVYEDAHSICTHVTCNMHLPVYEDSHGEDDDEDEEHNNRNHLMHCNCP